MTPERAGSVAGPSTPESSENHDVASEDRAKPAVQALTTVLDDVR